MATSEKETSPNGKECISTWKEELRKTNNALAIEKAIYDKATTAYNNACVWSDKLKTYWENIQDTNDLGKRIVEELQLFHKHTCTICKNTDCTVEALELLFCLIKEFFECTDALKGKVVDLQKQIECLNDPGLESSKVLQCLNSFSDKLDEAIAGQHDLIKQVISVLKCAIQLHESLCSDPCGLKKLLENLIDIFEGTAPAEQEPKKEDSKKHSHADHHRDHDHECGPDESCTSKLEPKPVLPLSDDPYYQSTEEQYKKAKEEKEQLKIEYDKARDRIETLTSFKNCLEDAIEAAEEAKACK